MLLNLVSKSHVRCCFSAMAISLCLDSANFYNDVFPSARVTYTPQRNSNASGRCLMYVYGKRVAAVFERIRESVIKYS